MLWNVAVQSQLNPQNDRKTWFNIVVFRYMYLSNNRKCQKMPKRAQMPKLGQNRVKIGQKLISRESLAIESWLTPQNDHKTWFNIVVFRYMYLSDNRKCPKNVKKGPNPKIAKQIGQKTILSREPMVVESRLTPQNEHKTWFTIHVCTSQTTGSAPK